jgi:pimeloyl-ACP methyl ester carboxylesterase
MRSGRTLEVCQYGDPAGHPVFFFHGLIGSHHQASYIAAAAEQRGLRVLAPNRPGVGRSEFVARASPLDVVTDVEDLAAALGIGDFSLIGISGGTQYVLATLYRLADRVRTVTVISGMGPARLPGALRGMERSRRLTLELGSRFPNLLKGAFHKWTLRFQANPTGFLDRLVATWSPPDQEVFRRKTIYDLFLCDMHQVFTEGNAPEGLAQEVRFFRNYGFALRDLPPERRVTLWQGLCDVIVPPAMAWTMVRHLPNAEMHLVPGGHFMAVDMADQMVARLRQLLDDRVGSTSR